MPEETLTIHHKVGLHARPAALFVQTAMKFQSTIQVTCGERQANAKSILKVLSLGAGSGSVLTIQAEGADADQAVEALAGLIRNNFGEI